MTTFSIAPILNATTAVTLSQVALQTVNDSLTSAFFPPPTAFDPGSNYVQLLGDIMASVSSSQDLFTETKKQLQDILTSLQTASSAIQALQSGATSLDATGQFALVSSYNNALLAIEGSAIGQALIGDNGQAAFTISTTMQGGLLTVRPKPMTPNSLSLSFMDLTGQDTLDSSVASDLQSGLNAISAAMATVANYSGTLDGYARALQAAQAINQIDYQSRLESITMIQNSAFI